MWSTITFDPIPWLIEWVGHPPTYKSKDIDSIHQPWCGSCNHINKFATSCNRNKKNPQIIKDLSKILDSCQGREKYGTNKDIIVKK